MQKEGKVRAIWLDGVIVASSFILAFSLVSRNEAEKRVSLPLGALLVVLGSCFFVNITNFLNKLMLSTSNGLRFIKHYNLTLSDCLDISNKYTYKL